MAKIHIKSEKLILFGVFFRLWRNYLLFRKSVIIRDVILIIRDISFRKHIVGQSFQFGKRHVLYGMFYLANSSSLLKSSLSLRRDVNLLLIDF